MLLFVWHWLLFDHVWIDFLSIHPHHHCVASGILAIYGVERRRSPRAEGVQYLIAAQGGWDTTWHLMFFDTDTNTYISIMILRLDSHDSFIPIQVPQFSLKYFIDPPYLSSESATWLCSEPALYLPFALPLQNVKTTFLTLLEDEIKIFFSKQRELKYSDQRYTKTKLMWPQVSILIKC